MAAGRRSRPSKQTHGSAVDKRDDRFYARPSPRIRERETHGGERAAGPTDSPSHTGPQKDEGPRCGYGEELSQSRNRGNEPVSEETSYWDTLTSARTSRRRALEAARASTAAAVLLAACGGGQGKAGEGKDKSTLVTPFVDTTKQAKRGGILKDRTFSDA